MKVNIFPNSFCWSLLILATVQTVDQFFNGTAGGVDYFIMAVLILYWVTMLARRQHARHVNDFILKNNN